MAKGKGNRGKRNGWGRLAGLPGVHPKRPRSHSGVRPHGMPGDKRVRELTETGFFPILHAALKHVPDSRRSEVEQAVARRVLGEKVRGGKSKAIEVIRGLQRQLAGLPKHHNQHADVRAQLNRMVALYELAYGKLNH